MSSPSTAGEVQLAALRERVSELQAFRAEVEQRERERREQPGFYALVEKIAEAGGPAAFTRPVERKPAVVIAFPKRRSRTTPTAASRPRVRRTRAQGAAAVRPSDDPDLADEPPALSIAEGAALIAGRLQLPLWAGRP